MTIIKKSVCAAAVLLLFLLSACSSAADNQNLPAEAEVGAEAGFDSPEDAAIAYLEGLRDADLNRMISTFAIENYVEKYDFEAFLNRIQAYYPTQDIKLPNANEFVTAINIETRRGNVTSAILRQYLSLCNPELDQSQPQMMQDETDVSEFVAQLDKNLNAPELQTLKLVGFIPPEALTELYASPQNQANIARRAEVCGADQLVSRIAVFELDGNEYLLCFDAVEYGDKWYIEQFSGNIGALLGINVFSMGILPTESFYNEVNLETLIVPIK